MNLCSSWLTGVLSGALIGKARVTSDAPPKTTPPPFVARLWVGLGAYRTVMFSPERPRSSPQPIQTSNRLYMGVFFEGNPHSFVDLKGNQQGIHQFGGPHMGARQSPFFAESPTSSSCQCRLQWPPTASKFRKPDGLRAKVVNVYRSQVWFWRRRWHLRYQSRAQGAYTSQGIYQLQPPPKFRPVSSQYF